MFLFKSVNNKKKELDVDEPVNYGRRKDLLPLVWLYLAAVHVIAIVAHDAEASRHVLTPRALLDAQRHVVTHIYHIVRVVDRLE